MGNMLNRAAAEMQARTWKSFRQPALSLRESSCMQLLPSCRHALEVFQAVLPLLPAKHLCLRRQLPLLRLLQGIPVHHLQGAAQGL